MKFPGQGRFRLPVLLIALSAGLVAVAPAAFLAPRAANAASIGASLDQCQNGAMGTPITTEPCLNGTLDNASYANYTNGNANGNNSHWAEGSYLPYRDILTGLTPGTYSFTGHYDTVVGSLHAIDYIGSFDATETTSPTGNALHRNDNNPCIDVLGSAAGSGCAPIGTPPTPASTFTFGTSGSQSQQADPNLDGTSCSGSAGGPITRPEGTMTAFAPDSAGVQITGVTIGDQTSSGSGQCNATFTVDFTLASTAPPGGSTVVLAWGGHIASQVNWGVANSAATINGSPYHMHQDSLLQGDNSITIGSQDRQLKTNAIYYQPTVVTAIKDAGGAVVSTAASPGSVNTGTQVHDTAVFQGSFSPDIAGTVTYQEFANGDCTGTPAGTTTVNVGSGGTIPDDPTTYTVTSSVSFKAVFSGDLANDLATTSSCEPLNVLSPTLSISKTADAATVNASDPIGFTVTVSNTGTGPAFGVAVTDTLPTTPGTAWAIDTANSSSGWTLTNGVLAYGGSSTSLAAGASVHVHVTSPTTQASCGTVSNTASLTSTNDGTGQSSASVAVNCANVTITKAADASTANAGGQIGFTVTVNNTGAGTAYGVTVKDTLPGDPGTTWSIDTANSSSGWSLSNGVLAYGGSSTNLAAGASAKVHVTSPTTEATCGTVSNTASVTSTNDGSGQASASVVVACPKTTPQVAPTTTTTPPKLAFTGSNAAPPVLAGLIMLAGGSVLVGISRLRRRGSR